jgi:hypothetical protein
MCQPAITHISVRRGRLVVVFTDDDGARVLDVALVTAIDDEKAPEDLGR